MNTEQPQTTPAPSEAVHFLDYWQILYARKEIVIAVSLLMILTGIVITRQMPRVYAATALIRVQQERPAIDLFTQSFTRYDPIFLRTQFEIIKSSPVIEQVVREMRLDDEMGMAYGWKATATAKTNFERTVKLVQSKTTLNIRRDTDLIQITVRLDKPDKPDGEAAKVAANVANTVADVFLNWTLAKSRADTERGLEALKEEIRGLERQIAQAEDELAIMRSKHGITLLSSADLGGTSAIRSEIAKLTADSNQAQMTATMKKAKYERVVELSINEAAASLSILIGDNSLLPLLSDKQKIEMQRGAQLRAGLGPQHPDVIQTSAMLDEISTNIEQRVQDIKLGLKIDYEQAQTEFDVIATRLAEVTERERDLSSGVALEFENMQKDLQTLKLRKATLEERMDREAINLKIPTTSVEIIERAKVPEIPLPISPNFALNVTLSVVAGLFFGIVLAFFVEYLDTTIKSVEDIEKYLTTGVLGIIPQKIRALNDPSARSKHSEVYRVLRMNLKSSKKLGTGKSIVFTSASAGEGKSMTSFNLAYVCAEVGEKVLLIDADLHRPRQHKVLGCEQSPGLSNVIVGEATLDQAIQKTMLPNLDFLPSGRISNASIYGLMDTDEMRDTLKLACERYDRVVLDAPPMIGVSDTSQIARLCDGVALVVQHRKYPRSLCKRARDMITSMGGNLLGVVLNNINASHDYSSYYYEHQYYYYYYTNDSHDRRRTRSASKSGRRGGEKS